MKRNNQPKAEEIFYNGIISIIKGLLIENPNLKTDYYYPDRIHNSRNTGCLHADIKRFGNEIIARMEETKHLITLDPAETYGPDLLALLKKAEGFVAGAVIHNDEGAENYQQTLLKDIQDIIKNCEP